MACFNFLMHERFFSNLCVRHKELASVSDAIISNQCTFINGITGSGKSVLLLGLMEFLKEKYPCDFNTAFFSPQTSDYSSICRLLENNKLKNAVFIDDFHQFSDSAATAVINSAIKSRNSRLIAASRKKPDSDPFVSLDTFLYELEPLNPDGIFQMLADSGLKQDILPGSKSLLHSLTAGHAGSAIILKEIAADLNNIKSSEITAYLARKNTFFRNFLNEILAIDEISLLEKLSVHPFPVTIEFLSAFINRNTLGKFSDFCLIRTDHNGKIILSRELTLYFDQILTDHEKTELHLFFSSLLSPHTYENMNFLHDSIYHLLSAGENKKASDLADDYAAASISLAFPLCHIKDLISRQSSFFNDYQKTASFIILLQKIFRKDFPLTPEISEISDRFRNSFCTGLVLFYSQQYEKAFSCFKNALSDSNSSFRSVLHLYMSLCMCHSGFMTRAEEHLVLSETGIVSPVDHIISPFFHYCRSVLLRKTGKLLQALDSLDKSEKLCRESHFYEFLQQILCDKALIYLLLSDTAQISKIEKEFFISGEFVSPLSALIQFNRVINLRYILENDFCRCCNEDSSAYGYSFKAFCCLRKNDPSSASDFLTKSLSCSSSSDDLFFLFLKNFFIISIYISSGKISDATDLQKTTQNILEKNEDPLINALFSSLSAKVYQSSGDTEKSLYHQNLSYGFLVNIPSQTHFFIRNMMSLFDFCTDQNQQRFLIQTVGNPVSIFSSEVSIWYQKKDNFSIFIDFAGEKIFVSGKELNLFKKRIMSRLLYELASCPRTVRKTADIFRNIWEREYDPEADANTFRMNISRLRSLLDENPRRFIQISEDSEGYIFSPDEPFCIISTIR